jgi:FkbM family methyltransferase
MERLNRKILIKQNRMNKAEGNVDRIIQRRFFSGQGSGIFVDVGAAGPDYLSISALYRSMGWRVIAIEPNPVFCELHRQKGYEVLQYACGDHDEDNVGFLIVDSHGAPYANGEVSFESFSSLGIKDSYAALKDNLDKMEIQVNLRRLDTILKTHAPDIEHLDILSVDVEGWELEVLRGLSIEKYKPRVMVIENLFNAREYRDYMKSIGYILWRRVRPNDVYVRSELINPVERYLLFLYKLFLTGRK